MPSCKARPGAKGGLCADRDRGYFLTKTNSTHTSCLLPWSLLFNLQRHGLETKPPAVVFTFIAHYTALMGCWTLAVRDNGITLLLIPGDAITLRLRLLPASPKTSPECVCSFSKQGWGTSKHFVEETEESKRQVFLSLVRDKRHIPSGIWWMPVYKQCRERREKCLLPEVSKMEVIYELIMQELGSLLHVS